jgi:hypothetical protein
MIVVILIGMAFSSKARAASPMPGKRSKSHAYSCGQLMKKQRKPENLIVQASRRPKWR